MNFLRTRTVLETPFGQLGAIKEIRNNPTAVTPFKYDCFLACEKVRRVHVRPRTHGARNTLLRWQITDSLKSAHLLHFAGRAPHALVIHLLLQAQPVNPCLSQPGPWMMIWHLVRTNEEARGTGYCENLKYLAIRRRSRTRTLTLEGERILWVGGTLSDSYGDDTLVLRGDLEGKRS